MNCERPGGPFIDLLRDFHLKFPPNWVGELPAPATREELSAQMAVGFLERKLGEEQINEALNFFEQYELRYYEVVGKGLYYHRPCGGGAIVEGETGIFCAKCGKLPDLFPPACLR